MFALKQAKLFNTWYFLYSMAAAANFGTNHSKWMQLFPKIRPKLTTLNINTLIPLTRELVLSCGVCSASANSLLTLLGQSNDPLNRSNRDSFTSNAVGLIVGGVREQTQTLPNTYRCAISRRRGFIRIAMQTGASLVPAISFGENNLYGVKRVKLGFWGKFLENKLGQTVPPLYFGRGFFQYSFGLLPRRHPITTVIGAPIHMKKTPNPSQDELNRNYELFCMRLNELFELHKSKYHPHSEEIHLEIIWNIVQSFLSCTYLLDLINSYEENKMPVITVE